eukprot:1029680-Amphidinium_carterae.3
MSVPSYAISIHHDPKNHDPKDYPKDHEPKKHGPKNHDPKNHDPNQELNRTMASGPKPMKPTVSFGGEIMREPWVDHKRCAKKVGHNKVQPILALLGNTRDGDDEVWFKIGQPQGFPNLDAHSIGLIGLIQHSLVRGEIASTINLDHTFSGQVPLRPTLSAKLHRGTALPRVLKFDHTKSAKQNLTLTNNICVRAKFFGSCTASVLISARVFDPCRRSASYHTTHATTAAQIVQVRMKGIYAVGATRGRQELAQEGYARPPEDDHVMRSSARSLQPLPCYGKITCTNNACTQVSYDHAMNVTSKLRTALNNL